MSTGSEQVAAGIQTVQDEAEARAAEEAQRAIDEAQRAQEAAQELAKQLTDAALATELGRQIAAVNAKVEQCQTAMETQAGQLSALTAQLTELVTRLPQPSSTPVILAEPPETQTEKRAEGIIPPDQQAQTEATSGGGAALSDQKMVPRRRKM